LEIRLRRIVCMVTSVVVSGKDEERTQRYIMLIIVWFVYINTRILVSGNYVEVESKVYNGNNSTKLLRVSLTEILALCVLTPSTVDSAHKHVSGIYCCYLEGGSEWCVLWSVYVGTRIASETHLICRPWRWRLYIPPKCWCLSTVLQGVTVYKPRSLKTRMNETSRNL
jgi:hypothetical protein